MYQIKNYYFPEDKKPTTLAKAQFRSSTTLEVKTGLNMTECWALCDNNPLCKAMTLFFGASPDENICTLLSDFEEDSLEGGLKIKLLLRIKKTTSM